MNDTAMNDLFNQAKPRFDKARFNGSDYDHKRDQKRLSGQIKRVWECMKDGKPRTLADIETITGDPQASISAQLRHLRKKRFGGWEVDKEYLGSGLYSYTLKINDL